MHATQDETWLPIPGYDYQASSLGRIRNSRGVVLRPYLHSNGYYSVGLWKHNKCKNSEIHRIIAGVFHGPRPEWAEQVRHLDGNKLNNRADNLRYGTRTENCRDSVAHGSHAQGRKTHCSKGHEFTPENTYVYTRKAASGKPSTNRVCRICSNANSRRQDAKRTARKRRERSSRAA